MFSKKYCSKKRQMVKNGLTMILLAGWQKNELSVLECAMSKRVCRKIKNFKTFTYFRKASAHYFKQYKEFLREKTKKTLIVGIYIEFLGAKAPL